MEWEGAVGLLKGIPICTIMYNFFLNRIQRELPFHFQGKRVLNVACGPGREAEYYAKARGCDITGVDISFGAIEAAVQRSQRFDFPFFGVVGDAERLPFRDKCFNISLIDTALHHLPNPEKCIREMARVSREGFFMSEGAHGLAIRMALALGFTTQVEEAGNIVQRFSEARLRQLFRELGASEIITRRHWLNTSMRFRWGPHRLVTRFFESEMLLHLQDAMLGRLGNRLVAAARF